MEFSPTVIPAMTPTPYFSFLLRIWCTPDPDGACWQASLEDPRTRQVIGFGSVEEMVAFLRRRMEEESSPASPPGTGT